MDEIFLSTYCLYSLIPFLKESNTQLQGGVDDGADFTCTEGGGGEWNSKEGGREKGEYKIGIFENICSPSFAVRTSSTMAGAPLSASCACFTINLAFSSEYSCMGGGTVT